MAKVWDLEFKLYEKGIDIKPIGIIDREVLKKRIDTLWDSGEVEKAVEENTPLNFRGRIGGGIVSVISKGNENAFVLLQRDEKAPRAPLCFDISAGMGDATTYEEQVVAQPTIPLLLKLVSEMYEIIPQKGDTYLVYIPSGIDKAYHSYLQSTGANTIISVVNKEGNYKIEFNSKDAEIGEFSKGITVRELGEKEVKIEKAIVTVEKDEKSIELILPHRIKVPEDISFYDAAPREAKVRGSFLSFYDGEHFGNVDLHDVGIIPHLTPLDRYVVLVFPDGEVIAYKSGGVQFQGTISCYLERVGLARAIKEGKTYGMTSKVEKLYKEAQKGNYIKFSDCIQNLKPIEELGNTIKSIIERK
jgi:hypothetical protein